MKIIDRQNDDMVRAEQKFGESPIYSDEDAIELGNLAHARLIVTGSIT
ncbi:CsgG/HfaB family protein [Treponema saccharophilum]|nr:CsgG/HfaB family protein [Treponema saccharophilum]